MSHKRKSYTGDLSGGQWEKIGGLLSLNYHGPGRPIQLAMREVINAIWYLIKTGSQWKNLPHDLPNYNSVYYPYRKRVRRIAL